LKKAKPLGLKRGMSAAYARLGDIYRLSGDLEQAEKFFKKSYSLAKELDLTTSLGHAINNLAIIYFEKGDTVKAREYFEIGLEKRLKAKDQRAIADSYYNLGDYQFYIGKTALAETWYKRSLEYARTNNLRNEQKDALFILANLYKSTNDFKLANEYLERYIDLQDETLNENLKDDEEIKNKQLEFMRLELEAKSEGLMSDDSFWKRISVEWIVITVLGVLSLFLAFKLRKRV
jgi:tetratricopeptide (TPR) repeat protein